MEVDEGAVEELCEAVLGAARRVAEPVQAHIVAVDEREKQTRWLGIAFDALSFYIVLATKMATTPSKAQLVVNALGRAIMPEIAARFFSRNPPEAQLELLQVFQAGHYQVEVEYGGCRTMLPRGTDYDPDAMFSRFAYKLLDTSGNRGGPREGALLDAIFASIQSPDSAPRIFAIVRQTCQMLPDEA